MLENISLTQEGYKKEMVNMDITERGYINYWDGGRERI